MWLRGVGGPGQAATLQAEIQIPILSQGLFAGTGASWVAPQAVNNGMPGSLPGEVGVWEFCCFVSVVPALPELLMLTLFLPMPAPGPHPHHGLCQACVPAKQVETLTMI